MIRELCKAQWEGKLRLRVCEKLAEQRVGRTESNDRYDSYLLRENGLFLSYIFQADDAAHGSPFRIVKL